jgi:hypothetical protein
LRSNAQPPGRKDTAIFREVHIDPTNDAIIQADRLFHPVLPLATLATTRASFGFVLGWAVVPTFLIVVHRDYLTGL